LNVQRLGEFSLKRNTKNLPFFQRLWYEWIRPLIIVLAVVLPLRSSIADWYDVPTGSMIPTIVEGDRVVVNKMAYDLRVPFTSWRLAYFGEPKRGDIVVFPSPRDGVRLIKRVVGLPGDKIELRDNHLTVNDKPLEYASMGNADVSDIYPPQTKWREELPGHAHNILITSGVPSRRDFGPYVIPKGHYFMMGDNRDNSADSRYIGPIKRETIAGKALAIGISLDRKRFFLPRLQRFFHSLDG
jgi:signal peptidase I